MRAWLIRRPAAVVLGACVLLFVLYEAFVACFAYSGDASVESDVITIAAEVEGPVSVVSVTENQVVGQGAALAEVDPVPYRLAFAQAQRALELAQANATVASDERAGAQDRLAAAKAVATDAQQTFDRVRGLTTAGYEAQQKLDDAQRDLATANDRQSAAAGAFAVIDSTIAARQAAVREADAALAVAGYRLSRTALAAPQAGRVAPFTLRAGDYVKRGDAMLAIVADTNRRIVANVSERALGRLRPGQTVLFTIGSDPWVVHRGQVTSVAPGIARTPAPALALPYVNPTGSWLQLPRRFPVEIALGSSVAAGQVFVGANARVLIVF